MLSLEQYRLIVESSPNMIWRADLSTKCDYFNKTWLDFTGRTLAQELGFGWAEGVHPEDYDRCVKIYLDNFEKQSRFEMNYRLKRNDGIYRWINDRGVPYFDKGKFMGFIGSCMDITEKVEGQMLREMAQNDALCNTYNRQYSHFLLSEIFKTSQETKTPLSILMMDIDGFKGINDQYGHAAGDIVLSQVAAVAKNEVRSVDILGRYGGDEFLFGLVNTDINSAIEVAKQINSAIGTKEIMIANSVLIKVTVSIGIKCLEDEKTLDELIDNADKKLYDAKKEGKNRVKA